MTNPNKKQAGAATTPNLHDNDNSSLAAHLELVKQLSEQPSPASILLTTEEASILLRCTAKMLEERRYRGLPPVFQKNGSKVLYKYSDLLDSLDEKTNTCR